MGEATSWFRRAALQGHKHAASQLAQIRMSAETGGGEVRPVANQEVDMQVSRQFGARVSS